MIGLQTWLMAISRKQSKHATLTWITPAFPSFFSSTPLTEFLAWMYSDLAKNEWTKTVPKMPTGICNKYAGRAWAWISHYTTIHTVTIPSDMNIVLYNVCVHSINAWCFVALMLCTPLCRVHTAECSFRLHTLLELFSVQYVCQGCCMLKML